MKNAYLQHGKFGGPYRTESVPLKTTHHVPQKGRTQTGYGGRIPTEYMIRWRGRWHRVLCMIYSNSGTLYIHTNDPDSDRGRICVHIQ
jgi:hypothetical protein